MERNTPKKRKVVSEGAKVWEVDDGAYKKEVGRRLKHAREQARMTLQDVADALTARGFENQKGEPLGASTIGNWEQGTRLPNNMRMIPVLADIYHSAASWIMCYGEAPQDEREARLVDIYRVTDERGKDQILRVADAQSAYQVGRQKRKDVS